MSTLYKNNTNKILETLLLEGLEFNRQSLEVIQDTIERENIEYTKEDIANNEFLQFVAEEWPEDYDFNTNSTIYSFDLVKADKLIYQVDLIIEEVNSQLIIGSIHIDSKM